MSPIRPRDFLLAPAAAVYGLGVAARAGLYRAGFLRERRLSGRVVSVGNLSVGGTGKTPAIIALARWLKAPGRQLGVLTRGYGRRDEKEVVVLNRTETPWSDLAAMMDRAGDEPVLLARRLRGIPIGIAADRYEAGRRLEAECGVNLFLLDDGFQHLRLHRDVDIVLLDATARDDALLPRGRRREPWSALRRAHIVVITRTEQADPEPLIRRVRAVYPAAPSFCAETVLESVHDAATDAAVPCESVKGKRVFAFCGLGNDWAFWQNLASWGFNVQGRRAFRDHHRYSTDDLNQLLREAERSRSDVLLTTEKDIVNWREPGAVPIPLYYCRITLKIEPADEFVVQIEQRLEASA